MADEIVLTSTDCLLAYGLDLQRVCCLEKQILRQGSSKHLRGFCEHLDYIL